MWKIPSELPPAEEDTFPGLILGASSVFTVLWWFVLMFVYVKNHSGDVDLQNVAGSNTYPIAWFWERLTEVSGLYAYLAMSLFTAFFVQLLVSAVELIAWVFYLTGGKQFFVMWSSIIGYWGSLVLYAVPWIFNALHIGVTLKGKVTDAPGSYSLFLLIVFLGLWLLNGLLHIVYVPRLHAHVIAIDAIEALKQDRCPLKKGKMSDGEYIKACKAIAAVAKAKLAQEEAAAKEANAAESVEEGEDGASSVENEDGEW